MKCSFWSLFMQILSSPQREMKQNNDVSGATVHLATNQTGSTAKTITRLTESYLPATMQALAHYIELLQYEPLFATTIEPEFTVSTTPVIFPNHPNPVTQPPVQQQPVTWWSPPTTTTRKSTIWWSPPSTTTPKPWWSAPSTTTVKPDPWWNTPSTTTAKPWWTTTTTKSTYAWWSTKPTTASWYTTTTRKPWYSTTTTQKPWWDEPLNESTTTKKPTDLYDNFILIFANLRI